MLYIDIYIDIYIYIYIIYNLFHPCTRCLYIYVITFRFWSHTKRSSSLFTLDGSVRVIKDISLMTLFFTSQFKELYGIDYDDVIKVVSHILDKKMYTKTQTEINRYIRSELELKYDEQLPSFSDLTTQITKFLAKHIEVLFNEEFEKHLG